MKNNSEKYTKEEWTLPKHMNHDITDILIRKGVDGAVICELGISTSISREEAEANAEHICKAVNSFDGLVDALNDAMDELCAINNNQALIDKIDAALTKAKGLQKSSS